jgi:hypothetical protein
LFETNGEFPLAFLIKSQGNQYIWYNFSQDVDFLMDPYLF